MIRALFVLLLGIVPLCAGAEPLANALFGAAQTPSQQSPMPIGSYAKGCAGGMVELAQSGPT
jgi:penicillin-insensitive murein endopeptidase